MPALMVLIGEWLGQKVEDDRDLVTIVRRGLPITVSGVFQQHGLTPDEFHKLVIPSRTLKHRRDRAEPLNPDESGKAYRAARVLAFAELVFGSRRKALSWMRKPKKQFSGETPMTMLQDEPGARLVEEMLIRIGDGMCA